MRLTRRRILLASLASTALLPACSRKRPRQAFAALPPGTTVLALGDSITFGTGAAPESSYPAVLARLTGWNVVNAGVPGHVSSQALERTEALLAEHKPALVLLGIGGNDFLRRMPDDQARANIRRICELCLAAGSQVVLIAVPRPSVAGAMTGSLGDHAMYAELADALKIPLHASGWSSVLSDASLRSDQIHANAKGYERFAEGLFGTLKDLGLATKGS